MGHDVDVASTAEEGLCLATNNRPDLLILDVRLPGRDGLDAMEAFERELHGAPIVIITAFGDLATAMNAIRNGAFEYVAKPFDVAEIRAVIDRALRADPLSTAIGASPRGLAPGGMLGRSPIMQQAFKRIALAANSDASILLCGESGVGKELAASVIHANSTRLHAPFVHLSFAAIAPESLERELFGQADSSAAEGTPPRIGLLSQAHGGTLFIDEVGDIPLPWQSKLLHVLDRGEVHPLGAESSQQAEFRVIAATRHNLQSQVESGSLRADLLFRLNTFVIDLPPLRERVDDIRLLANHFAVQFAGQQVAFAEETLGELERRPWFGNVRELRSAIEHALVLARRGTVMPDHLPPPQANVWATEAESGDGPGPEETNFSQAVAKITKQLLADPNSSGTVYERFLEQVEPPLLSTVMHRCGQRCAPAARLLGLHRTTLKKKLVQYGIEEAAGDG